MLDVFETQPENIELTKFIINFKLLIKIGWCEYGNKTYVKINIKNLFDFQHDLLLLFFKLIFKNVNDIF